MKQLKNIFLVMIYSLIIQWVDFYVYADSLITSAKVYKDVFIMEGENLLYILNPEDGTIINLSKDAIEDDAIIYDEPAKREQLKAKWYQKQIASKVDSDKDNRNTNNVEKVETLLKPSGWQINEMKPSASSHVLKLKGNALQKNPMMRTDIPQNYKIQRLSNRRESAIAMRRYPVNVLSSSNDDNNRKIVLRNPPVSSQGYYSGYGTANYGMNLYPGMRGMPMPYPLNSFDVTIISNISDLFSTIDDRLVGEFPTTKTIILNNK